MWHPLRLAEDFATADILTSGRIVFGVGRGYHTREVETFGSPLRDQEANRALFEEQVDIIFKAFNNERFSHKGKYYTLPPEVPYRGYTLKELTLVPRPFNLPVECWQPIQGGSMRALEFMAKHDIHAWWAAARPRAGRCIGSCSTGRQRMPTSENRSSSVSDYASAFIFTWPTAASRASRKRRSITRKT
jgi:alkanesulfonate monooxygenase SsuD/methylene tetrahydromethanopterin reductase-like flavin-dependent oxidoreductase (luciferase family)